MFMHREMNVIQNHNVNIYNTCGHNFFFLLPVKIRGDAYSFDITESEYDNQIALSPTNVKWEDIKLQNCICNKKVIYWFLISAYTVQ
jgi:hypothetical protein